MEDLFREAPESITNTFAVAEMCDVKLPFGENNYPVFTMPPEITSQVADNEAYLKHQCIEGMQTRMIRLICPMSKESQNLQRLSGN